MDRRRFLAFAVTFVPCTATAQQAGPKIYRIGWLSQGSVREPAAGGPGPFRDALRGLGWTEGRDVAFVYRFAEGSSDRLAQLAAELVRSNVDVIVATAPGAIAAASRATTTIPIVMVYGPDPAESGLVASLARPGGNITGLTSLSVDVSVKQLQLIKEILPALADIGLVWNPTNPWHAEAVKRIGTAAQGLGVRIRAVAASRAGDLDAAVESVAREHAGAVLVLADPLSYAHRARLAQSAAHHRLPMMTGLAAYAEAGGLASYWPDSARMFERAAGYVDKILTGARPSDLPVEQPTKFELTINLRTAAAIGVAIPPSVLLRADNVIQ